MKSLRKSFSFRDRCVDSPYGSFGHPLLLRFEQERRLGHAWSVFSLFAGEKQRHPSVLRPVSLSKEREGEESRTLQIPKGFSVG
jgi:hypothetical protein